MCTVNEIREAIREDCHSQHGMAVVLMVDAVCGAQHNGAAAILTAHGGRVDSFLLFLVFHGPFTSVRIVIPFLSLYGFMSGGVFPV